MGANTAHVSPRDSFWVLVATILPSSMAFIATSSLDVALPALQADLDATGTDLLWIRNGYALFLSALILLGGALGDRLGRKRIFMIGIAIFTVTSVLCGLTPSVDVLIALRVVQGIGGALMVPGSLAILTASFPPDRRGSAIGTWATFSAITTVLGAPLGGLLAGAGLWRAVFFINVPLGVIALVVLAWRVPESRDPNAPPRLDYPGALLTTISLGGLTYGFSQASEFGFGDARILGALAAGIIGMIAFVIVEARSDHPLVPLRLFRSRTFSGTNLLTLFLYATLGAFPFFFPLNLVQVQGYPEQIAGLAFMPFGLLLAVLGRWSGGLVDRVGARLPLVVGPLITGVGYALFALPGITDGPSDYWTTFFPPVFIMGLGMAITVPPLTTTVMNSAPEDSTGTASGINNAISRTAGVLALAIVGGLAISFFSSTLFDRVSDLDLSDAQQSTLAVAARDLAQAQPPDTLTDAHAAAVNTAIDWAFVATFRLIVLVMAGLCIVSAAMAFALVEARPQETEEAEAEAADRAPILYQDQGCPTCPTPAGD